MQFPFKMLPESWNQKSLMQKNTFKARLNDQTYVCQAKCWMKMFELVHHPEMFESHFSTMFESRLNGKTFPSSTMFDENV
jgi:hypothetical protein